MSEARAITYKEVRSAVGAEGVTETWRRIAEITGSGLTHSGLDEDASMDLTGLSDTKLAQIDKLLGKETSASDQKKNAKESK